MKLPLPLFLITGCPNSGKTALFCGLTGQADTCCYWAGSTTAPQTGLCKAEEQEAFLLLDVPSSNTLKTGGTWETITGDFLSSGLASGVLAVCSCLSLERGLSYLKELIALEPVRDHGLPVILCLSFWEEAAACGLMVDTPLLSDVLQIPVLPFIPGNQKQLALIAQACAEARGHPPGPWAYRCLDFSPKALARAALSSSGEGTSASKVPGPFLSASWRMFPTRSAAVFIMFFLLFFVLWGSLALSSPFSRSLSDTVDWLEKIISSFWPQGLFWERLAHFFLQGLLLPLGRTLAIVLPPVLLLLPLFALLEEIGLVPRLVMAMDRTLARCGMCSRQGFAILAGLWDETWGLACCRAIPGPVKRLHGYLTNCLIPCWGKFPSLLFLALALTVPASGWAPALLLTIGLVLCVTVCLGFSLILNRLIFPGRPSFYPLELPPLRRPRFLRRLPERLLSPPAVFLGNMAARFFPIAVLLWGLDQIPGPFSLLERILAFLEPAARIIGLNGAALLALLLSSLGNEVFIPSLLAICFLTAPETAADLLSMNPGTGWSSLRLLCTMILVLFHWPQSKSLSLIYRDTGSLLCCFWALLLPLAVGVGICLVLGGLF